MCACKLRLTFRCETLDLNCSQQSYGITCCVPTNSQQRCWQEINKNMTEILMGQHESVQYGMVRYHGHYTFTSYYLYSPHPFFFIHHLSPLQSPILTHFLSTHSPNQHSLLSHALFSQTPLTNHHPPPLIIYFNSSTHSP